MRISLSLTNVSWPALRDGFAEVVQAADEGGLDTLWLPDHLLQADPSSTLDAEMLEAYCALGYAAAISERIRLGTLVTAAHARPPALLVKAVTTLDVLSDGRAWLGIGTGYHELEAAAMGLSLPPIAERYERLEETLRIARQMFAGDESPFEGVHHRLARPLNVPAARTRPHPPILIGGAGERRTLRLVAQYADACNLFDIPDGGATVTRKLAALARHCDELGRPYEEIEKTITTRLDETTSANELAAHCHELAEHGLDHAIVISARPWTVAGVATLAAVAADPT